MITKYTESNPVIYLQITKGRLYTYAQREKVYFKHPAGDTYNKRSEKTGSPKSARELGEFFNYNKQCYQQGLKTDTTLLLTTGTQLIY
jgi:hypothetical protein